MIEDFLATLESVPWFRNIGRPMESAANIKCMQGWEDWPGPEDPYVREISQRQQTLYDDLFKSAADERDQLVALWNRIQAIVFRVAAPTVPYDQERDSWHAPTAAIWQAAWTAGLVGLCLRSARPIPSDLEEQWMWFVQGHWPAGYARMQGNDEQLLVY